MTDRTGIPEGRRHADDRDVTVNTGYRYHPGTRLALLQGRGPLSLDRWEDSVRQVLSQASWRGTRRILSDRRWMDGSFPPTMEEHALAFFRKHAQELGDVQWAVVVSNQAAAFDTVRLAAELSKSTRVRVQGFTDISVALHWVLGIGTDYEIAALMQWVNDFPRAETTPRQVPP